MNFKILFALMATLTLGAGGGPGVNEKGGVRSGGMGKGG